jgi:DNA-binding GntR family transcriptional regulator
MTDITPLNAAPDLAEQAYRAIIDAICDGRYVAGQRITQEALAESLAVSRQPILQAILLLKRDGLVIDAGGRGVMVAPLTADHIANLYQVRSVLDGLAAREAARRQANLSFRLIGAGRAATRGRDLRAMIEADIAFHRAIYEAAGNPVLLQAAERNWNHIRRIMGVTLSQAGARHAVWDEHEKMLELIVSGRPDAAQQQALLHCEKAGESLVARLGSTGDASHGKAADTHSDANPVPQSNTQSNSQSNPQSNSQSNPDSHQRRQA